MAKLSDFLSLVRGKLPGCPEMIMKEAVRESAIEFCKRTRLIEDSDTITTVAGTAAYDLSPPSGLAWEVFDVYRGDVRLTPSDRVEFSDLNYYVDSGEPRAYYLEGDGTIVLGPIPSTAESLTVRVTVRPDDTAGQVPQILYQEYRTAIAAGARLFVRQNYRSWNDDREAEKEMYYFDSAIARAQLRRAKGSTRKPLRTRSRYM